jgi:hypothetical protein
MPEIDFTSPIWLQVAAHCRVRIDQLRAQNEGDLDPVATAKVRGQIKALKELVDLPKTAARQRASAPDTAAESWPFGHQ